MFRVDAIRHHARDFQTRDFQTRDFQTRDLRPLFHGHDDHGDEGHASESHASESHASESHGHDAESHQPETWTFPKNPTRDEKAERELLEIIFTLPELTTRIREEITPADFMAGRLRQLLEICFQMHDEGGVASYERVTTRLEDAGLKNLAADI